MTTETKALQSPQKILRRLLVPLMTATFSVIMTLAMFAVAVPFIRSDYGLTADRASWLIVAYNLPFMALMPLYGRFGDRGSKRSLLLLGLMLFMSGTVLLLFSTTLPVILLARVIQGAGAAGVNPLAMSIIVEYASPSQRGKALGTWNSMGPASGILGPLLAGPVIDAAGWRSILLPALTAGVIAFILVKLMVPSGRHSGETAQSRSGSGFDWTGVILFNLAISFIVFFTSSRPITGADPLTDLRLLGGGLLFLVLFILHSKRAASPFINLSLFRNKNLTRASISVSIRMLLLGSVHFAVPLLVTDIYGFTAAGTAMVLVVHSTALLITMQLGGYIIDRWKSRNQIIAGSWWNLWQCFAWPCCLRG
jgi:MFS family permease